MWAVIMAFLVSFVMAYLLGGKSVGESNKISFQEFLGEVQSHTSQRIATGCRLHTDSLACRYCPRATCSQWS